MVAYRARSCPRCQYYVGFTVSEPYGESPEALVKSFCLNCNYQLPVRAVVRGMKNSAPSQKPRTPSRGSSRANDFHGAAALSGEVTARTADAPAPPRNYPRDLRAIGQELEKRRFTTFNLKCSGESYFVWSTENLAPPSSYDFEHSQSAVAAHRRPKNLEDPRLRMLLDRIVGFYYGADDISRVEREGMKNRRVQGDATNGRRLSHLLRTVGEQVYRRHQRLLAIAWQEGSIGVVSQTAKGRREMNVLRPDRLYDLWVKMYLRRSR